MSTISSRELAEWHAFARIDPFDAERDDLRAAIVAATIANVNRSKHQQPMAPWEFMPFFKRLRSTGRLLSARIRAAFMARESS